jgi:hypothetical protein
MTQAVRMNLISCPEMKVMMNWNMRMLLEQVWLMSQKANIMPT